MKKRVSLIITLLLFLSLCACTQEPVTESTSLSPNETVMPAFSPEPTGSPEIKDSPTPVISPEPSVTAEPAPSPEPTESTEPEPKDPTTPVLEPPLDERAQNVAVPKFLTQEQQELYRRANTLYRAMFGGDTHAIDYFDLPVGSYQYNNDTIEFDGMTYQISTGRYADWSAFNAVIHSLFSDQFWASKNTFGDGLELYTELDGKMAFISAARGGGYYHRSDVPDEFELISMSKDEVVFTLIGHYEVFPHNDEDVFYTAAFTIRMVRTEDGWRFDEFHDTLADEVSENDPRANFAEQEDVFLLPVYSNTLESGSNDHYYIDESGTLLMWGYTETTNLKGGSVETGPRMLMDNIAGIYVGTRGIVLAVDEDGTLWSLDGGYVASSLNPLYQHDEIASPIWLMDDVSMVSISYNSHIYILKRDGSLWHWGYGPSGYPGWLFGWNDPEHPAKPDGEFLTKIMDNVVYTAASGEGGWAITSDGALWEWGICNANIEQIMTDVVCVTGQFTTSKFALTKDGDLYGWTYDFSNRENGLGHVLRLSPQLLMRNVTYISGAFALQENGILWNYMSWPENSATCAIDNVVQFSVGMNGLLCKMKDGSLCCIDKTQSNSWVLIQTDDYNQRD